MWRVVLIRHRVGEDEGRGGKRLLEVPGYRFLALVTSLPKATHPPLAVSNLRFRLFVTAGVLRHPGGRTMVKLAVPKRERDWWRRLWEKILSPVPNCNAMELRPNCTG